mmetsp:Transcript_34634/g.86911  ORF Transcript_34634/g.86911 Transcript_34634/m.86911 type:complete len:298 (+) Transcript_34634:230-1123(+)
MQHGETTNAAEVATHRAMAWSVALPHACSATPTSNGNPVCSIIPTCASTFVRPAAAARRTSRSALRCFISTAVNRMEGKRLASGSVRLPLPEPKSTTRNPPAAAAAASSVGGLVGAARSRSSSRSTTAKDSTCHRLRMARRLTVAVAVKSAVFASLAMASSSPSWIMDAGSQASPMVGQSMINSGDSAPCQAGTSSRGVKDAKSIRAGGESDADAARFASAGDGGSRLARMTATASCFFSFLRRLWRALCALCCAAPEASSPSCPSTSTSPSFPEASLASSRRRLLEPFPITGLPCL